MKSFNSLGRETKKYMKIKLLFGLNVLLFFIISGGQVKAQTINLRFSTYFYSWKRIDSINNPTSNKTTHIQGYQSLLFDVDKNKWSFNTLIQTEEDVTHKIARGFSYRFFNLYVKGSNLFNNMLDVKLGREYVFAGIGKGSIDGLYFKVKAGKNKEYQLAGYAGYSTPLDYEFNRYPALKNDYMAGAQFSYYGVKDLIASASYLNRHHKPPDYTALRFDTLFNVQEVTIDINPPTENLVGVDFNYTYKLKNNFYGRAYYSVTSRQLYRGEVNARVNVYKELNLSAGYLYRQPQLGYNTIFWVFEHKANQEIEGGADYTLKNGMNLFARVGDVIYSSANSVTTGLKNNALRLQVGVNNPGYGVSYLKYTGYSGESDGVNAYFFRELLPSKLSATISLDFSKYRLGEFSGSRINSLSGMLGFTYRPFPQFSVDAQGQFINNRIYKTDARFLLGLNYWLFKKY